MHLVDHCWCCNARTCFLLRRGSCIGGSCGADSLLLPLLLCFTVQVSVDQQQQQHLVAEPRRGSAELRVAAAATAGSLQQQQPGALKFVDRDEHVYFWFPLLAGLSELAFDPRPEIRRSALEVGVAEGAAVLPQPQLLGLANLGGRGGLKACCASWRGCRNFRLTHGRRSDEAH
jgi:hypothetical protein